ncbi:hypothetical protein Ahy_B10g101040 [Arachis hypogaea]|uniref:At5g58720/SDE5-like UBA-like domain-containing protein n=1 Tax=Arachis hypogaea TaxID=3818 RepID=A0A444WYB9_ARAHY|nr:hypothetical protein Ahy_B10g101040 [Arachis hypogaea]
MEVPAQNIVTCDEEKALKCLLDAFGSVFSLEEIASAYCKASRNADLAGEMLYEMKGTSSSSSSHSSNADARVEETSGTSDGYSVENSSHERKNLRAKARSVSVGTVSGTIGRDYVRPVPSANGSHGATKPVKMDVKEMPLTGICREKARPNVSKHNQLQQDMEDFLFKMLGNGFQLDRDMIRGVLESCGYDMQKSMYRLLDPSNVTFDRTAVVGDSASRFTDVKPKSELSSSESKSHNLNHLRSDRTVASNKGVESHQKQKHKDELQKEILFALFKGYQRCEEAPKKTVKDVNNSSRYKHVVFEPPEDTMEEYKIDMDFSLRDATNDVEDEDYQCVRRAVKEYRATMNEYYKAAVDAFANGDKFKAEKLIDQFVYRNTLLEFVALPLLFQWCMLWTSEAQEMLLDLHDHGSREAIRLLKCHLSSLAGIPSFEYLKVIIDASNQENTKGSRRRAVENEKAVVEAQQQELKYLEFVQFATIQAVMRAAILYSYAKERSGPLKSGVETVEEAVKTVVAPVYDKFHLVPTEFLHYVDRKVEESVAEIDRHVPTNVKVASNQACSVVSSVRRTGVVDAASGFAKSVYDKYEPKAEECAVSAWRKLKQLPLFPIVAGAVLPKAAYYTAKYNEAVTVSAKKGYKVSAYLPLVPTEKIVRVFGESN